ncbi:protein LNK3 isoform X1 [Jatropha curcas]|uniref:protein LNK3 isoform X1 n=1 Tax=Jatropha curcas TaxID=180498 RepID=UPI0005FBB91B|nr:protein LNK3 isoform X1 [Jatropha curcas]
MDWYVGSSIEELVVPKDQEPSDRFLLSESWPNWGTSDSESFDFPSKSFDIDSKLTREKLDPNGDFFSNEVEGESCIHDKDRCSSSIDGGTSEESLYRTAVSCDQLDSLSGFEQMDDIFFSSLIEDLTGTENLHHSFCFEPEFQNHMVNGDNVSRDMILDTHSILSGTHSMGSSMHLKTHIFSPTVDQENNKVPAPLLISCNSGQKHCPVVKVPLSKVLVPSEHNRINEHMDEETSLEESVLQDLESVMAQLTDKTRLCFRDALYRLAKNSRQHEERQDHNGNMSMKTSPWTGQEEKMRPERRQNMELETNIIDRTVANLMFNKMDIITEHDFPASASISFREEATKPLNYKPQSKSPPACPLFSSDCEVPILCQGETKTSDSRCTQPNNVYGNVYEMLV